MDFLTRIKSQIVAVPLSQSAKDMLPEEQLPQIQESLKGIQNQLASSLDKLEKAIKKDIDDTKFRLIKKYIRTNLAKWLYLSSFKQGK